MLGWLRRTTPGVTSRQPASSVGAIDGSAAIGGDAIHSPILNNPTFNISIIANAKGVPEAPLRAVLEKLGEKRIPEEEIPARLNAAADELVRLRADLARLRNDRPEFAAIRARASALIDQGDFDGARAVLRRGREAARALREEVSRSEAMFLADEARINRLQLNNEAALENLTEASRLDPENTWVWINLGDLWLERGSLVEAGSAYAAASKAAVASGDDRDRMITQSKLADVSIRQGDRPTALTAYRLVLEINEAIFRRDPGNAEWQRDLSVSHNRIGDVLRAEGDREGALNSYRAGLAIAETLARRDPGNTEWQRDLSVSHDRIGDVLVEEGDREGALKSYRAGLAIREVLARRDPGNAEWQRDLIVSCVKIAGADPQAAPALLTRALDIAKQLEASGKFAPVDAWMPGELTRMLAELTAK